MLKKVDEEKRKEEKRREEIEEGYERKGEERSKERTDGIHERVRGENRGTNEELIKSSSGILA